MQSDEGDAEVWTMGEDEGDASDTPSMETVYITSVSRCDTCGECYSCLPTQSEDGDAEVWTLEEDDPKVLLPERGTPNNNAKVCMPVCTVRK